MRIVHKASDFKYPTKEERKIANEGYPKILRFGFEYKDEIYLLLSEGFANDEIKRISSLFHWDLCLQNKLGKLHESYVYLITHYNRGIPDDFKLFTQYNFLNKFLFDFYTEMYYYLFFSIRDVISQIINIHCDINKHENEIYFHKLIPLIINSDIKQCFLSFQKLTKKTSDYRNKFTHGFPENQPDNRPSIDIINGLEIFYAGTGDFTKSSEFVDNIKNSLLILKDFIDGLREIIKAQQVTGGHKT